MFHNTAVSFILKRAQEVASLHCVALGCKQEQQDRRERKENDKDYYAEES